MEMEIERKKIHSIVISIRHLLVGKAWKSGRYLRPDVAPSRFKMHTFFNDIIINKILQIRNVCLQSGHNVHSIKGEFLSS